MDDQVFTPTYIKKAKTNLDKCFDSIFEDQLCFQIETAEVKFIQTGIETLIEKLLQEVDRYGEDNKDLIIEEFLQQNPEYQFICYGTDNNKNIYRVGSFYEETKNIFPDEFDYIYVICTLQSRDIFEESDWMKHYFTLNDFHETIKDILTRVIETENYFYCDDDNSDSAVFFEGYNRIQGPSSKLTFTYKQNIEETFIDVDVVPAFKIIDKHLPLKLMTVCNVPGFAKEIIETNCYLITNEISFTRTELRFMKTRLSTSHKKAYRILKYLFNGNNDGEKLRKWVPKSGISTYMIKVAIIHHHYKCGNDYNTKPSKCVLTTLKEILKYCVDYDKDDLTLIKFHGGEFQMQHEYVKQTIDNIEKMIIKLELMQGDIIEPGPIKCISQSILDHAKLQSSTGQISRSSSRGQIFCSNSRLQSHTSTRKNSFSSLKEMSRSLASIRNVKLNSFKWKSESDLNFSADYHDALENQTDVINDTWGIQTDVVTRPVDVQQEHEKNMKGSGNRKKKHKKSRLCTLI